MRRLLLPATCLLTLLSGLALANTRLVLSDPGVRPRVAVSADNAATRATAVQFYDAVNAAIATGATAAVAAFLAPAFQDHAPFPGASPDRAGYLDTLARLHAANPTLALRIETLVVDGERVALALSSQRPAPDAAPLPLPGGRWPTTEILQVDSGQILARWGNSAGLALATPVVRLTVSLLAAGRQDLALRRLTIPDKPQLDPEVIIGPHLVLVEQGSLSLHPGPGSRSAATLLQGDSVTGSLAPGFHATLDPGEAILFARGSFIYTWSASEPPAVVVSFAITPPFVAQGEQTAGLDRDTGASPAPATSEPVTLVLGLGVTLPSAIVTLTLSQVALAPGVTVPSHRVTGAELLALSSGHLTTTVEDGTAFHFKPTTGGLTLTDDPALLPGQGLFLEAGTEASYHAGDTEPATLLLVTIEPGAQEGTPVIAFPPATSPP